MLLTAGQLRSRAALYRESANTIANTSQPFGDHVALADQVAGIAAQQSQSPRMDHDVLRLAAFVEQIRGMPSAATAVGLTLHAVANDLEQFAAWRDGIDSALDNAATPQDVVEANRALVRLELALDETCSSHARAIARDNFPIAVEATAMVYAEVVDTYGAEATVAYDQDGRPLYIDTGHGEVIELNDSDYPAVPYER